MAIKRKNILSYTLEETIRDFTKIFRTFGISRNSTGDTLEIWGKQGNEEVRLGKFSFSELFIGQNKNLRITTGYVYLLDNNGNELIKAAHNGAIEALKGLITISNDGVAKINQPATGPVGTNGLNPASEMVLYNKDGKKVFAIGSDGLPKIYDGSKGYEILKVDSNGRIILKPTPSTNAIANFVALDSSHRIKLVPYADLDFVAKSELDEKADYVRVFAADCLSTFDTNEWEDNTGIFTAINAGQLLTDIDGEQVLTINSRFLVTKSNNRKFDNGVYRVVKLDDETGNAQIEYLGYPDFVYVGYTTNGESTEFDNIYYREDAGTDVTEYKKLIGDSNYALQIATRTTLGGIKQGDFGIDADGSLRYGFPINYPDGKPFAKLFSYSVGIYRPDGSLFMMAPDDGISMELPSGYAAMQAYEWATGSKVLLAHAGQDTFRSIQEINGYDELMIGYANSNTLLYGFLDHYNERYTVDLYNRSHSFLHAYEESNMYGTYLYLGGDSLLEAYKEDNHNIHYIQMYIAGDNLLYAEKNTNSSETRLYNDGYEFIGSSNNGNYEETSLYIGGDTFLSKQRGVNYTGHWLDMYIDGYSLVSAGLHPESSYTGLYLEGNEIVYAYQDENGNYPNSESYTRLRHWNSDTQLQCGSQKTDYSENAFYVKGFVDNELFLHAEIAHPESNLTLCDPYDNSKNIQRCHLCYEIKQVGRYLIPTCNVPCSPIVRNISLTEPSKMR